MGPATRSGKRSEYRKTRSTYTGTLRSLPYKIEKAPKAPKYECVLCERRFRSRGWAKTHFRSHATIPYNLSRAEEIPVYTHPSCWPATEAFTWEGQNALLGAKRAEGPDQHDVEDYMQQVEVLTSTENAAKQEVKKLGMWWWWWTAQGDDIKEVLRRSAPGRLNITDPALDGTSGELGTGLVPDEQLGRPLEQPSSAPGNSLREIEGMEDNSLDGPTKTDWLLRQQAPVAGRLWTELDLTGRNALRLPTVRQFISTCNIDFLAFVGETPNACDAIANAIMAYIARLTPQSPLRVGLHALLQRRATSLVCNPVEDRKHLCGAMKVSTEGFFARRTEISRRSHDEGELTLAMAAYAEALGDSQARRRALSYGYGPDNALDAGYDARFGRSQR
ncbi:MAG: hypothetical protein Q9191_002604 [Dirinaria sp. TL-2023a]